MTKRKANPIPVPPAPPAPAQEAERVPMFAVGDRLMLGKMLPVLKSFDPRLGGELHPSALVMLGTPVEVEAVYQKNNVVWYGIRQAEVKGILTETNLVGAPAQKVTD